MSFRVISMGEKMEGGKEPPINWKTGKKLRRQVNIKNKKNKKHKIIGTNTDILVFTINVNGLMK